MSRTYRRKNQESAFWSVKRNRHPENWDERKIRRYGIPEGKDPYQVWLKKVFHADKSFAMRNPSWWNRLYGTVPLRAHNKMIINKIMKMKDIEDHPIFYKRMRIPYYW